MSNQRDKMIFMFMLFTFNSYKYYCQTTADAVSLKTFLYRSFAEYQFRNWRTLSRLYRDLCFNPPCNKVNYKVFLKYKKPCIMKIIAGHTDAITAGMQYSILPVKPASDLSCIFFNLLLCSL